MLSNNPFTVPPEELKDIQVEMTVIGGTEISP
jgi:predicted amidohydrolase YtcJ